MKKLLFLCCTMLCGISAFSQISFNQSASTVTSGQQVTLTSTGENHSSAPGNKYINNLDQFSVVSASPSSYLSSQTIVWSGGNYSTLSTPTVIIATLTNTASVPVTVTYKFRVFTYDNWGFFNLPPYDQSFTVTVNPVPVITYHSVALSQTFTKNSCGPGFTGSQVPYSLSAGAYTSTISQADANSKAQTALSLLGQNNANNIGTCTPIITYAAGPNAANGGSQIDYTLPNLPSNYTVTWSVDGPATVASGGNTTTASIYFTALPGSSNNGLVTLRITISDGVNPPTTTVVKKINVTYCDVCP
jgi:uncharacterized protein YcfL